MFILFYFISFVSKLFVKFLYFDINLIFYNLYLFLDYSKLFLVIVSSYYVFFEFWLILSSLYVTGLSFIFSNVQQLSIWNNFYNNFLYIVNWGWENYRKFFLSFSYNIKLINLKV